MQLKKKSAYGYNETKAILRVFLKKYFMLNNNYCQAEGISISCFRGFVQPVLDKSRLIAAGSLV